MKQNYRFEAHSAEGQAHFDITLRCTQQQAGRVFNAMAYAMAMDGEWDSLRCTLILRNGQEGGQINATKFGGRSCAQKKQKQKKGSALLLR